MVWTKNLALFQATWLRPAKGYIISKYERDTENGEHNFELKSVETSQLHECKLTDSDIVELKTSPGQKRVDVKSWLIFENMIVSVQETDEKYTPPTPSQPPDDEETENTTPNPLPSPKPTGFPPRKIPIIIRDEEDERKNEKNSLRKQDSNLLEDRDMR